jgi:hypothetical protein
VAASSMASFADAPPKSCSIDRARQTPPFNGLDNTTNGGTGTI